MEPTESRNFETSRRNFFRVTLGIGTLALTGCEAEPTAPVNESAPSSPTPDKAPATRNPNRLTSSNEVVRGLSELESRCNRQLFSGAMEFFAIPATPGALADATSWQPNGLGQLREAELKPTVILEPSETLSFNNVGAWPLDLYFDAMRHQGVTDQAWGRVAIAPEFIVGEWQGNAPQNFKPSIKRIAESLHRSFPEAQATVLLDTDPAEMNALLPQLEAKTDTLASYGIESVGVQAFANGAPIPFGTDGRADISSFLSVETLQKIAETTEIKKLWINTGITKEDSNLGVSYTVDQRVAVAHAIADVVEETIQRGLIVEDLMVFAQNKLGEGEGRDFSFPTGHEPALTALADRLTALNVPLGGFAVAA